MFHVLHAAGFDVAARDHAQAILPGHSPTRQRR